MATKKKGTNRARKPSGAKNSGKVGKNTKVHASKTRATNSSVRKVSAGKGSKRPVRTKNSKKTVVKSIPTVKGAQKRKKFGKWGLIIGVGAVLLIILGVIGAVAVKRNNGDAPKDEKPGNETSSSINANEVNIISFNLGIDSKAVKSTVDSELQVNNYANYKVAANKPRYMSIPAIGVSSVPIIELGVTSTNQMESPKDPGLIGWYYKSALPGTNGTSVLNAHGGDLGVGIFKNLPKLAVGGEIVIEMGDGRKYTYVVVEKVYKNLGADSDKYMEVAFTPPEVGKGGLTIITCTGEWIRASQTYSQRLFVRAVLKN